MICVSLEEAASEDCLKALQKLSFAEIRLDRMSVTEEEVEKIFSSHPQLIATCRPGAFPEEKRRQLLKKAIAAGAAYVDMELEAPRRFQKEIKKLAAIHNCRVIVSTHLFEGTPSLKDLQIRVEKCFAAGAQIAKISCWVRRKEENARLLALLSDPRPVVVTGMGKMGMITRVGSLFCGSPFTFASLEKGKETAEGQLDQATMEKIIRMISDG